MKRISWLALALTACSTGAPKADLPPGSRADGTFLHLDEAAARSVTPEALIEALNTVCEGPCDRLYADVGPQTTDADALRLVAAAETFTPPPRVYLNTDAGPVELAVGEPACEVTVTVRAAGAGVMRGAEILAPDPTCAQWRSAICRGEDDVYDWPRLRSEVGTPDMVCVAFETKSLTELGSIEAILQKPTVRIVAPQKTAGELPRESLTTVIEKHGNALQWCLDGEVLEKPVPMSLTLRLAVHTDGTVTRAEVIDAVRTTTQFEECVRTESLKFSFTAREDSVVVEVPLEFTPGASAPTLSDSESAL